MRRRGLTHAELSAIDGESEADYYRRMRRVLIVDDKQKLCESLGSGFAERGWKSEFAFDGQAAVSRFSSTAFDVVLLDVRLGEEDGTRVLVRLREIRSTVPIIMITGFATIESAVSAIKLGAVDYIQKPIEFPDLFALVRAQIQIETAERPRQEKTPQGPRGLVFISRAMSELVGRAKKLAATDLPVLISGESGTGKELVAEFIHANSPRKDKGLCKVNCAAFSESLLDNELFGHEKGAYTGADSTAKGLFESAHGGTLFLDELGDMPLSIQAKILRAIQNYEVRRLGGSETLHLDVRFIAATNKDLSDLLRKRLFREDLFYRLSTAVLFVPPLRERVEDIGVLTEYFLEELARKRGEKPKRFGPAVRTFLETHAWPGNVRELRSALQYAVTISSGEEIIRDDFQPGLGGRSTEGPEHTGHPPLEAMERELILKTLRETQFNKKRTAEMLSISRATLYKKMEKYGIPSGNSDLRPGSLL